MQNTPQTLRFYIGSPLAVTGRLAIGRPTGGAIADDVVLVQILLTQCKHDDGADDDRVSD